MKYLFDTNAIIYLFSGKGKFPDFTNNDEMYLSFIAYIELIVGISNEKIRSEIKLLLKNFEILYPDEKITEITIELRRDFGLKIPDAIIGATALYNNATLITADKEIIKKLSKKLKIINPLKE